MSKPQHLLLVRHGESEGNVANNKAKLGDFSSFTDEFVTTPGRTWRLTEKGKAQAVLIGAWLQEEITRLREHALTTTSVPIATRHYVSPYVRTQQTAGFLGLKGDLQPIGWLKNRSLRERDWGDIDSIPKKQFEEDPQYRLNAWKMKSDPLYWRPPGGESIEDVVENRVKNFMDTLDEKYFDQLILAVTHGEFMKATRVKLERQDDDEFLRYESDRSKKIANCQVLQYTKSQEIAGLEPNPGSERLQFARTIVPLVEEGRCEVSPWTRIDFHRPTNEELLAI